MPTLDNPVEFSVGESFNHRRGSLNKVHRRWRHLRSVGVRHLIFLLRTAVFGHNFHSPEILSEFSGHGIEIGGPSQFFQDGGEFPIYSIADEIDNVNFSNRTFWEGKLEEGRHFQWNPNKGKGYQFIYEASDLSALSACSYDFVASCHTLEHCANPIKALSEWRRVLKNNGRLVVILPHKAGTFDHRRRVTEFDHLLKDFSDAVAEDDETHFAEILEKHDLDRDLGQGSRSTFQEWIRGNSANRGVHHHVFDPALAIKLIAHVGFEVVAAEVLMPFHIFIVARKSDKSDSEKEDRTRQILEVCSRTSPFRSDRNS